MSLPAFQKRSEDLFWKTLHHEVNAYFIKRKISPKATAAMYFKAAFFIFMTIAVYLLIIYGRFSTFAILGLVVFLALLVAGVGFNVSHEAMHGAFSKNSKINRALGLTMDLVGPSSYLWKINHSAHHSHTNIHGLDGDIKDSGLLRLCPFAPYRKLHKYQIITAVFIYSTFYLLIVYVFNFINITGKNFRNNEERKHPVNKIAEFIIFKTCYLAIWIIIPFQAMNYTFFEFGMGYLIFSGIVGSTLSLIFFIAHTVESTAYVRQSELAQTISWAEHQLKTTSNFKTNRIFRFYLGGLNYQVEHHLFPGISSIHYSKLSPIIMKVANDFGVSYLSYDSLGGALKSHFRLLRRLSRKE